MRPRESTGVLYCHDADQIFASKGAEPGRPLNGTAEN